MTPSATHRVPLEIPIPDAGCTLAIERAWPAPNGALVVEGTDPVGRCRAGSIDAEGIATVTPHRHDTRLPGLSSTRGTLLVHRLGKRAVLRDDEAGRYVKVTRPGKAARIHQATRPLAGALSSAGFETADESLDASGDLIHARAVAGSLIAHLDPDAWGLALAAFERSWGSFATKAVHVPRASSPTTPLATHTAADEASILAAWLDKLRAFDPLRLSAATTRLFVERVERSCQELTADARRAGALAHRDLHDGQLLFDPDSRRLAVLDLDTAALTEPELDLANLLAHLDFAAFTGSISRPMRDQAHAMIERLQLAVGGDPERFACYRTTAEHRIACVWAFRPRSHDRATAWLAGER
ncbi:phosphotransferase [Pseudoclavibacter sp. 8L]|uniref:phosphotransferase n=1 Tax=Pseudoclavibacter sp. 8L TaxID=2653162 RepID=UPI0012F0DAAC|nr:phosphotransferase [Pseudoclavibacter sp. 8L]VXB53802.1 conserved hypothetical protein [Pseudoclavibacter sp. 8L]